MSVNQLIPVSAPQRKRRLRGFLYAGALLTSGGVIGAIVAGPVLGQGPGQGPMRGEEGYGQRWHRGWSDNQEDDGREQRGRGFGMEREGGGFGMRERDEGPRMGWRDHGPRMGWHGDDEPRMGGGGHGMLFPGAIERRVNRVLGAVDASTEQRQKVRAILEAAGNDIYPIRQKRMENRKQIGEALAAATIDRAKIEQLRTEQMKLADAASKRLTDALAEAAEVLTPAQRSELGRRMERWRQWRRG